MEDPNSAAAANMVAAGRNFWGNVQQLRENRFTKQRVGIEQQQADTAKANSALEAQKFNAELPGIKLNQDIAGVNLAQAKRADFLQNHDPTPDATNDFGNNFAEKNLPKASPYTNEDVDANNAAMYGSVEKANQINGFKAQAPAGYVKFQLPDDPEDRKIFHFNIDGAPPSQVWALPKEQYDQAAQQYHQVLAQRASSEFQKPFDEMHPDAQKAIIASYKKNAPPGVKVSDADAIQAFRSSQLRSGPVPSPASFGLIPTGGEFDPMNPTAFKLNLTAPIGGPNGGSALTPEQYDKFGKPLQDLVTGNAEYKAYQEKKNHVANVNSYADESNPTVSSDKSLIMSYLKSIDPTVRVSEGTVTTVMDGMGVPDEIKNMAHKVMTGSLFTPEHREWFKNAANQNLENARQTAAQSLQSQLSVASATGNPLAKGVKLPPNVLPPAGAKKGPGHGSSEGQAPGSSDISNNGIRKFSTMQQAEAAKLPPGTEVMIFDGKKYRKAVSQ